MNAETPINELRETVSVEDAEQLLKSGDGWRVINTYIKCQQTSEARGNGKMEIPRYMLGRHNPERK